MTQDELKGLLDYDPLTGIFTWVKAQRGLRVGDKAGYLGSEGYIRIGAYGKLYMAHRLAWLYMTGKFPENQIDHINRVGDDNRISNLRDVKQSVNSRNAKMSKTNTSGVNGVSWLKCRKKWQVQIRADGKLKYLGLYADLELAALVRKEANVKYGFHPNHGRT